MKVIIAEKPSVARNIADAVGAKARRDGFYEGAEYLVTWAFGHLLELFDAKEYGEKMSGWRMDYYPFIPEHFQYRVKSDGNNRKQVDEGAKKQLEIIGQLIARQDVSGVISATDFDREGQIIGDIILEFLKVDKPIERLLLNEWTSEEVNAGLKKLVDNTKMSPLRDAGISRQWADWTIGINLTSVTTLKYQRGSGKALNIGRVLLPTLKIIYDRDLEIENFVPEAFHKLTATFNSSAGVQYDGVFMLNGEDKFTEKPFLELLNAALKHQTGIVADKQAELKREYPPSLFNLSNLQGYITAKEKGWTSDRVLKVAQSLYEKKLITYPRTASMALEESLTDKAAKVLEIVKRGLPYEKEIQFHTAKRVFDNSKVESHSAIIPTYVAPKQLTPEEKVVYEAVRNRFVMQFMPVAEHEEAVLTTMVDIPEAYGAGECGLFITRGRIQKVIGWKKAENIQSKDKELPNVSVGDLVAVHQSKVDTKSTAAPKRHTEKSLLKVMETCGRKYKSGKGDAVKAFADASDLDEDQDQLSDVGIDQEAMDDEMVQDILSGFAIGTPATRAETITKLKNIGYIGVKGKSLYATELGRKVVTYFPIKALFDLEYTGRLEKTLSDIGKGIVSKDEFLNRIFDFTRTSVEVIKKDAFHIIQDLGESQSGDEKNRDAGGVSGRCAESLGKCPECGAEVVEGEKGFGCTNWKGGCKFVIWKEDRFLAALKVRATAGTVRKLLTEGRVVSNSFTSKKGTKFSAALTYEKNAETGFYNWKLNFPKNDKGAP